MTPCERKRMANRVVNQAMMEMACADPGLRVADAARQIAREGALHILAVAGPESAAEALYALADEMVGAK